MAMTKKDYETIAAAIKPTFALSSTYPGAQPDAIRHSARELAERVADALAERSGRKPFDRGRFLRDCGASVYPNHEGED